MKVTIHMLQDCLSELMNGLLDVFYSVLAYTREVAPPSYMNCPFILKTFVVGQRIQYITCLYCSATAPSRGML